MKITANENDTNGILLAVIFIIRLFSTSAFREQEALSWDLVNYLVTTCDILGG